MGRKINAQEHGVSETGNWNVAAPYTFFKIMTPLANADEYETIAIFGTSDMVDEFVTDQNTMNIAKIKALKRLCKILQLLVNNTKFAVIKSDREIMKGFLKDTERVWKLIPMSFEMIRDDSQGSESTSIKEDIFNGLLEVLVEIKSKINEPLNRADLIFISPQDIDMDKLKEQMKEDFITGG